MKAYSIDLRKKIVESVRRGVSKSSCARTIIERWELGMRGG
jgi:hypothetical protein